MAERHGNIRFDFKDILVSFHCRNGDWKLAKVIRRSC